MSAYEMFKLRTILDGTDSRNAKINDAKHILDIEFKNDPSYCDSMYNWVPGVNSHCASKVDIRLFGRKYSAANGYTVQFEMQMDESPDVGNYYYDSARDKYWICTELFEINHIYYGGKLTLCNWILKWQNERGAILEYPCQDINSTQYNSGESGNQNYTLGSAQHMATVQATKDTIAIRSPRRFFVSRDYTVPFQVTQNDTVSNFYGNGLCKITLTQDQLNPKVDRPDLGLCDYIPKEPSQEPENPDKTVDLSAEIIGERFLKYGYKRTYRVKFKDKYCQTITDVNYTWNIESNFEINKEEADGNISLTVNNESCIGSSFSLQVIVNENVVAEIPIMVVDAF